MRRSLAPGKHGTATKRLRNQEVLRLILRAPCDALQSPKKMGLGESKHFAEGGTLVIGRA